MGSRTLIPLGSSPNWHLSRIKDPPSESFSRKLLNFSTLSDFSLLLLREQKCYCRAWSKRPCLSSDWSAMVILPWWFASSLGNRNTSLPWALVSIDGGDPRFFIRVSGGYGCSSLPLSYDWTGYSHYLRLHKVESRPSQEDYDSSIGALRRSSSRQTYSLYSNATCSTVYTDISLDWFISDPRLGQLTPISLEGIGTKSRTAHSRASPRRSMAPHTWQTTLLTACLET